jgi:hypothetical protein
LRLQDEIGSGFRIEEGAYPFGTATSGDDRGDVANRAQYLKAHPSEALESVEKEALRRLRKHKSPQSEFHLLDPGLWSSIPEACWTLELRLSERQGVEFFLQSPDEPNARKQFLRDSPAEVSRRRDLVAHLRPLALLPEDAEEGDDTDEASESAPKEDGEAAE